MKYIIFLCIEVIFTDIMFIKAFLAVFVTIFLAELGDKTQIATLLFASKSDISKWGVFFGASVALILASGIGVFLGSQIGNHLPQNIIQWIAGIGFIIVGIWTILTC